MITFHCVYLEMLHQTKAERLLNSLRQFVLEPFFGFVSRQIKKIEAGVRDGQIFLIVNGLEE